VFITARQFNKTQKLGELVMRRLTVGTLPPNASSSGAQYYAKIDVPPDS